MGLEFAKKAGIPCRTLSKCGSAEVALGPAVLCDKNGVPGNSSSFQTTASTREGLGDSGVLRTVPGKAAFWCLNPTEASCLTAVISWWRPARARSSFPSPGCAGTAASLAPWRRGPTRPPSASGSWAERPRSVSAGEAEGPAAETARVPRPGRRPAGDCVRLRASDAGWEHAGRREGPVAGELPGGSVRSPGAAGD